jgi:hypothetical protein
LGLYPDSTHTLNHASIRYSWPGLVSFAGVPQKHVKDWFLR